MSSSESDVGPRVWVFDTTLRDGEQSPGATMTVDEKLEMADALVALGVDIIEAGFPAASPGDFEAVKLIAGSGQGRGDRRAGPGERERYRAGGVRRQGCGPVAHPHLHRDVRHPPRAQAADDARAGARAGRRRWSPSPNRSPAMSSSRPRTQPGPTGTSLSRSSAPRSRPARRR